ncbi:MAG TPA: glycogen-binding domain-containing protein [Gemmatimonadales bacterium]|nr:glycogen-binding domain-containing protein [Gemmatimonadales bacterium]
MRRRTIRRLLIGLAVSAGAAAPCPAQVDARLDVTGAVVRYDGFLSSGAAAVSSSVAWTTATASVAARGTFLLFESGNTSVQGMVSAGTFTAPAGPWRLEVGGEAGGSAYSGYEAVARFAHLLGHARLHLMGSRWGVFAGALGGLVTSPGASAGGASGASAGAWVLGPATAAGITWTRVSVGGATYDDFQGRARWTAGPVTLEATAGAQGASGAPGSGAYGDVSTTLRLSDRLAAVVAAGSYASDPVSGSIPGRYVTAGLRLATHAFARRVEMPGIALTPPTRAAPSPWLEGARVALELLDAQPMLVVYLTGTHSVEVMGDFTDWKPVALVAETGGRYRYSLPLASGLQRFNIRLDGGAWGVPQGAALGADDFGNGVGVLVVP